MRMAAPSRLRLLHDRTCTPAAARAARMCALARRAQASAVASQRRRATAQRVGLIIGTSPTRADRWPKTASPASAAQGRLVQLAAARPQTSQPFRANLLGGFKLEARRAKHIAQHAQRLPGRTGVAQRLDHAVERLQRPSILTKAPDVSVNGAIGSITSAYCSARPAEGGHRHHHLGLLHGLQRAVRIGLSQSSSVFSST